MAEAMRAVIDRGTRHNDLAATQAGPGASGALQRPVQSDALLTGRVQLSIINGMRVVWGSLSHGAAHGVPMPPACPGVAGSRIVGDAPTVQAGSLVFGGGEGFLHRRADDDVSAMRHWRRHAELRKVRQCHIALNPKTPHLAGQIANHHIFGVVPSDCSPGPGVGAGSRRRGRRRAVIVPVPSQPGIEGVHGAQRCKCLGVAAREDMCWWHGSKSPGETRLTA